MHGSMLVSSVQVVTVNPNSRAPITFRISANFTGQVSPGRTSFDVPATMQRSDALMGAANQTAQGTLTFALVSGTAPSGTWSGSGDITMGPQPAGDHPFAGGPNPEKVFDYTGMWDSGTAGTVTIAP